MGTVEPMGCGAVLVVDDDEGLRTELRAVLEADNYIVVEARDGKEALDLLRSATGSAIRLMVLDLVMPCMTGWEVVELLRRDRALSGVPVLVTSAMPVHGDASGIGATMSWLRKPFDEEHFLGAVRNALGAVSEDDQEIARNRARGTLPSHHDA